MKCSAVVHSAHPGSHICIQRASSQIIQVFPLTCHLKYYTAKECDITIDLINDYRNRPTATDKKVNEIRSTELYVKAAVLSGVILYRALCLLTQRMSFTAPVCIQVTHIQPVTHISIISVPYFQVTVTQTAVMMSKKRDRL